MVRNAWQTKRSTPANLADLQCSQQNRPHADKAVDGGNPERRGKANFGSSFTRYTCRPAQADIMDRTPVYIKARMAHDHPRLADCQACLRAEIAMNDCGKGLVIGIPIFPCCCRSGEDAVGSPPGACTLPAGWLGYGAQSERLGHWATTVASGLSITNQTATFASRDGQARFWWRAFSVASALLYLHRGSLGRDASHARLLLSQTMLTPPRLALRHRALRAVALTGTLFL
jgi:hypothetical protein